MTRPPRPPRSRITRTDLCDEVIAGILQKPARALLTSLGTALGVAAFVAVLGLIATAAGQVSQRFTALAATEVTLERTATAEGDPAAFPSSAQDAVRRLAWVPQLM